MFHRRRLARSRRDYELQPAADFLFAKRPYQDRCADEKPGQAATGDAHHAVLVAGHQKPYRLTRLDELRFSRSDVPALTVTADPANSVAVAGSERSDWSLRFCVQGAGESEHEARQRLHEISMVRSGGTVSLSAPHLLHKEQPATGRGNLVVDGPVDASVVIHASYAAVQLRDVKGPVRIAATHGRATILDTTGQLDATAFVIDFSAACGHVTLSAEAEINMRLPAPRFEGALVAWAQRCVRLLVPPGFTMPFRAIVSRRQDFVCRTEFASDVRYEKKGDLHYFTYAGADTDAVPPDTHMHLRSEQATVVIDTNP